ncbi:MAG TPA: alkaline phosphatase family protein [Steroidobacteraceae bacterium]
MKRSERSTLKRAVVGLGAMSLSAAALLRGAAWPHDGDQDGPQKRQTKHIVIIFQENASFDHYFGTYPNATNSDGTRFTARDDSPTVNGLTDGNSQFSELLATGLHNFNPNMPVGLPTGLDPNGLANPFRLTRNQAVTCSNNHDYHGEQLATNSGLMDKFPQLNVTNGAGCATDGSTVMGYYDGNTVTALWNWAQHFGLNDNSFGTSYGPSTPGALNLISGQLAGAVVHNFTGTAKNATGQLADAVQTTTLPDTEFIGPTNPMVMADVGGSASPVSVQTGTLVTDLDPYLDDCGGDKGGTVKPPRSR